METVPGVEYDSPPKNHFAEKMNYCSHFISIFVVLDEGQVRGEQDCRPTTDRGQIGGVTRGVTGCILMNCYMVHF